jgi:hypothetical protein
METIIKVIVVRQPWAWLIVQGFKDIENRSWNTRYRGPLLIQASAGRPSKRKLEEIRLFALARRYRRDGATSGLRYQQSQQMV